MAHPNGNIPSGKHQLVARPGKYSIMTAVFNDDNCDDGVRQFTVFDGTTGNTYFLKVRIDTATKHRFSKTQQYSLVGFTRERTPRRVTIEFSMCNNQGSVTIESTTRTEEFRAPRRAERPHLI